MLKIAKLICSGSFYRGRTGSVCAQSVFVTLLVSHAAARYVMLITEADGQFNNRTNYAILGYYF
jgi:hypothetical protein